MKPNKLANLIDFVQENIEFFAVGFAPTYSPNLTDAENMEQKAKFRLFSTTFSSDHHSFILLNNQFECIFFKTAEREARNGLFPQKELSATSILEKRGEDIKCEYRSTLQKVLISLKDNEKFLGCEEWEELKKILFKPIKDFFISNEEFANEFQRFLDKNKAELKRIRKFWYGKINYDYLYKFIQQNKDALPSIYAQELELTLKYNSMYLPPYQFKESLEQTAKEIKEEVSLLKDEIDEVLCDMPQISTDQADSLMKQLLNDEKFKLEKEDLVNDPQFDAADYLIKFRKLLEERINELSNPDPPSKRRKI